MGNRFILVLASIAVLFFGLLIFNKKDAQAPDTNVQASSHTIGSGSVTLVEYGDFQCPFCGQFHPVLQEVKAKYGDKITFQFRSFPIISAHPNAMAAHRAAEAADKQGKFWEMHDRLFESQSVWSTSQTASSIFESYAKELGLDLEKFKSDAASSAVNDIIQADLREGQALRVDSTPTFFLNGSKLTDPRMTVEYFSEKIDEALGSSNSQQ